MTQHDHYASPFGAAFSAHMERPRLSRAIARAAWGADIRPYYQSMGAIAEVPDGGTVVDCPCGAGPAFRAVPPGDSIRYVAVDLSPSMIRRAQVASRGSRPGGKGFGPVGTQLEIDEWLANAGFALSSAKRSGPMLFFDARAAG